MEIQLIIKGVPVHCTINEFGRVWNHRTNREQKQVSSGPYKKVKVRNGKGSYLRDYIHRLVVEHFIGPSPEPDMLVNHKDGDTHNNHVNNLEWVTPGENILHYLTQLRHLNRIVTNNRVRYENPI